MALIPPWHYDCVVAIGVKDAKGETHWVASGFLYGHFQGMGEDGKPYYNVYTVTNRHVLEGLKEILIRSNPQGEEPAKVYPASLIGEDGSPIWVGHPREGIDVAVVATDFGALQKRGMQVFFFAGDRHAAPIAKMKEVGVTEGDFAYVLGFPMGLVGERRNSVIVRSGSIARIRDMLSNSNDTFLVDALIFPGNSGGPVVLKPEVIAIAGTGVVGEAYLIGIVQSYLAYDDVAVSVQTQKPRVVFSENSGLAAVHPVDHIEEAIRRDLEMREQRRMLKQRDQTPEAVPESSPTG